MSEQERTPLRDVLANAKNELLEAQRELERARQQIQTQNKTVQQELGSLSKLRDELASNRAAVKHEADQFRADWENFRASIEAFGQLTQGLQKQHDALLQLVQSKDNDLKAALKALNDSAASLKENLDPDTDKKLEEIRKGRASFLSTCNELEESVQEVAKGNQRIDELWKSIRDSLSQSQLRLDQLSDIAKKSHATTTSATAIAQQMEKSHKALEGTSTQLYDSLAGIQKDVQSLSSFLGAEAARQEEIQRKQTSVQTAAAETAQLIEKIRTSGQSISGRSGSILESAQFQEKQLSELAEAAKNAQANLGQQETDLRKVTESSDRIRASTKQLQAGLSTAQESIESLTSVTVKLAHEENEQVQESANLTASANESFAQLTDSAKQVKDMLDNYLKTAKDSRGKAMEALTAKREELELSLDTVDKSWQEAAKEYGEMAGVVDSAIKEIKLQREQYGASSGRLKDSVGKLLAERKALTEELAALRAEREKRLKARTQGICPACGRKVAPKDVFCDRCGASVL